MPAIAMTITWINHDRTAGTNNDQRLLLKPSARPIADASATSGGTTDMRYIEQTPARAKGNENFMPENQFLVLHSHISPKFLYMRVLSKPGAYSVNRR